MSYRDKLLKSTFDEFLLTNDFAEILSIFDRLCGICDVNPSSDYPVFYKQIRSKLKSYWKTQPLFTKLDKKYNQKEYKKQQACQNINVLVTGAGPCGLRCGIELALLGARVVIIEKREAFSRNNVLHLWPYVISDLNQLGAKKFFGLFCSGSINHISIKRLQSILLKVSLLLGVQVYRKVGFEKLIPPQDDFPTRTHSSKSASPLVTGAGDQPRNDAPNNKTTSSNDGAATNGWQVQVTPTNHIVNDYQFDVLIGANGRSNLLNFKRKELRCKLAIAITVNFVNHNTPDEVYVEEISGIVCIFNQEYFKTLYNRTGIDLENIVYYKDETHYFVMTVKKHCLLTKGVLKCDYDNADQLLNKNNVDNAKLQQFAMDASKAATNYKLDNLEFSMNHRNEPDVAMFDFTKLFAAEYASRIVERNGYPLLQALIGDSLLEPFWPTGSGCALGFLSSLDAAWLVRRIGIIKSALLQHSKIQPNQVLPLMLEAIAERENIYQRLSQTTPKNMPPDFNNYTLNPKTRYSQCRMKVFGVESVLHLYDTDQFVAKADLTKQGGPGIIIKFRDETQDKYFGTEEIVRWFQIKLSFLAQQNQFSITDITSIFQSPLPLKSLIYLYRPDIIDLKHVSKDESEMKEEFEKILSILETEFQVKSHVTVAQLIEKSKIYNTTISNSILQPVCNGNSTNKTTTKFTSIPHDDKYCLQLLTDIWRNFKILQQETIDGTAIQPSTIVSPTCKKSTHHHHYLKRLTSKRHHHHHNHTAVLSPSPQPTKKQFLTKALAKILTDKDKLTNNNKSAVIEKLNLNNEQKGIIHTRSQEILDRYRDSKTTDFPATPNLSQPQHKSASSSKISNLAERVFNKQDTSKSADAKKLSSTTQETQKSKEMPTATKETKYRTQLSNECCHFCKKFVEQEERDLVRQWSHSKRCICVQCCQELKLGVFSTSYKTAAVDETDLKKDSTMNSDLKMTESTDSGEIIQSDTADIVKLLRKCLLGLRRVNDESDEDYNGSCEDVENKQSNLAVSSSQNEITGSQLEDLFIWPNNYDISHAMSNCNSIYRSRLEPGADDYDKYYPSSSSSCTEDIEAPPPPTITKLLSVIEEKKENNAPKKSVGERNKPTHIDLSKISTKKDEIKENNVSKPTKPDVNPTLFTKKSSPPITLDIGKPMSIDASSNYHHSLTNIHASSSVKSNNNNNNDITLTTNTSVAMTPTLVTMPTTPILSLSHFDDSTIPRVSSARTATKTTNNAGKSVSSINLKNTNNNNATDTMNEVNSKETAQKSANKHLAKFKFCSEPPKPLSINPKAFISEMNRKKLQKLDLDFKVNKIRKLEPIMNLLLSLRQTSNQVSTNNHTKISLFENCQLHKVSLISTKTYRQCNHSNSGKTSNTPKTPTSPALHQPSKSIINPVPTNKIVSPGVVTKNNSASATKNSSQPPTTNRMFESFLNTDEFKDIDSFSINTEDSFLNESVTKNTNSTNVTVKPPAIVTTLTDVSNMKTPTLIVHEPTTNKKSTKFTSGSGYKDVQPVIKMRATLESDLEKMSLLDSTSINNLIISGNNMLACSTTSNDSDDEDDELGIRGIDEDGDDEDLLGINDDDHNNNNDWDKKSGSRSNRSSFRRKLSLRKSYEFDTNQNHTKKRNSRNTTSPPLDIQFQPDSQLACREIQCSNNNSTTTTVGDLSSNNNLLKFTDINEMCKQLDSIEFTIDCSSQPPNNNK